MKIAHSLALLALCSWQLAAADLINGDFKNGTDGWTVDFPKEIAPSVEVVPAAADGGGPALKIAVADVNGADPWKGKLIQAVDLPAAGEYLITFQAMTEQGPVAIEVSAWKAGDSRNTIVGQRKGYKLGPDWQEFEYRFAVEGPEKVRISIENLARQEQTFLFARFKLVQSP